MSIFKDLKVNGIFKLLDGNVLSTDSINIINSSEMVEFFECINDKKYNLYKSDDKFYLAICSHDLTFLGFYEYIVN